MTALRIVSITHPCLGGVVGIKRLDLLPDTEVTILSPYEGARSSSVAGVRRISMPTTGRDRRARFPSLSAALDLLDPNVVHLHADPDTSLALQVARLCGGQKRRGLVLETELNASDATLGWAAAMRARRTLARTDVVVARTAGGLAALRRLGFEGPGMTAGRGLEPEKLPDPEDARMFLRIAPGHTAVIGWAGPLDARSHVTDLLEAVALCKRDVVVLIPAAGPGYQDVLDRADALEILHRIRFVPPERPHSVLGKRPDLSAFPTLLAAVDALLVAPPAHPIERGCALRTVELAHIHAIPVIHSPLPEMSDLVGAGGWEAPIGDPALLARLFDELQGRPHLVHAATASAAANATQRHSPEASAAELARAIGAASAACSDRAAAPAARPAKGALALMLRRQPGST